MPGGRANEDGEKMSDAKRAAKTAAISDFLELGANAFVGGVMVAIALAAITLALASGAQETRSAAPAADGSSTVVAGALWDMNLATPAKAGAQPKRASVPVGLPPPRE